MAETAVNLEMEMVQFLDLETRMTTTVVVNRIPESLL